MKKYSIGLLLLFLKVCYAQVPHIFALHINGINTTQAEARDNTYALKNIANINSNMVSFDFVWNPTGDDAGKGFWSNLFDVMNQKANEHSANMSLDDFTQYWIKANKLPNYPEDSVEYQQLKSQITSKYTEQLNQSAGVNFQTIIDELHGKVPSQFTSVVSLLKTETNSYHTNTYYNTSKFGTSGTTPDLQNIKLLHNMFSTLGTTTNNPSNVNYLNTKNMVLLLPHSQGNLYANSLYTYLTSIEHFPPNQIASFGIATPAVSNIGGWISNELQKWEQEQHMFWPIMDFGNINNYVTSSNDYVINSARILYNQYPTNVILPANYTANFSSTDILGHNLIDIYLRDIATSSQINKMINLDLFWFQNYINQNMNQFGMSFVGMRGESNNASLTNTKTVICDSYNCSSSVLFNNLKVGDYKLSFLNFPVNTFSHDSYSILVDLIHIGLLIQFPKPIEISETYGANPKYDDWILGVATNVRDYTVGGMSNFIADHWINWPTEYPSLFYNGMLKMSQFTLDDKTKK